MPAGRIVLTSDRADHCEIVVLGAEDKRLAGMLVVVRAAILGAIGDLRERNSIACGDFVQRLGDREPICGRCQWRAAYHTSPPRLEELRGPSVTIPVGAMAGGELAAPIGVRVLDLDVAAAVDALERNLQAITWLHTPTVGGRFALVGFWPVP